jgi:hypothetical protein
VPDQYPVGIGSQRAADLGKNVSVVEFIGKKVKALDECDHSHVQGCFFERFIHGIEIYPVVAPVLVLLVLEAGGKVRGIEHWIYHVDVIAELGDILAL